MRSLKVVGTQHECDTGPLLICADETNDETFSIEITPTLNAAVQGELSPMTTPSKGEPYLSPREIQHRIRSGQSVHQVAVLSGCSEDRVERFAHPVLLERSRVAQLALAAHPIREDGPAEHKLSTLIKQSFVSRGLPLDSAQWDAWKGPNNLWIIRLSWTVGKSENRAHWQFTPGSHGGTVLELDDSARELIDPRFQRSLQSVSGLSRRMIEASKTYDDTSLEESEELSKADHLELIRPPASAPARKKSTPRTRTSIPAWEDVLLGVRSAPH